MDLMIKQVHSSAILIKYNNIIFRLFLDGLQMNVLITGRFIYTFGSLNLMALLLKKVQHFWIRTSLCYLHKYGDI